MKKRLLVLLSLVILVTVFLLGCDIFSQKAPEEIVVNEENKENKENKENHNLEEEETLAAEDFEITLGDKAKISEEEIRSIYSTDINMLQYFNTLSGRKAPNFKMTNLDGEEKYLSDFEGENIIIEFMGSWCPVCVSASEVNDKFNKEYEGAKIISIGISDEVEPLRELIKEEGIEYTEFYLPESNESIEDYDLFFVPIYFYIDSEGYVQMILAGDAPYDMLTNYADKSFK